MRPPLSTDELYELYDEVRELQSRLDDIERVHGVDPGEVVRTYERIKAIRRRLDYDRKSREHYEMIKERSLCKQKLEQFARRRGLQYIKGGGSE